MSLDTGNTPPKKDVDNYGNFIPFVKPPELIDKFIIKAQDNLSEKGAKLARILPPNSTLVSCIGGLGKTGINKLPVAFNQQINAVVFSEEMNPLFGFYYCQTLKNWLYSRSSATTLPIINKTKFGQAPFPVAPTPEQQRIVSKIEELFTKLDAGVEALMKAKAQLNRYRQAVLKSAFEGKLTEEWRAQKGSFINENTEILVKKIKIRRKQYSKAKGKKTRVFKLPSLDNSGLRRLPDKWEWVYIQDLCIDIFDGPFGSNLKTADYTKKGVRVIRLENVNFLSFVDSKKSFISEEKYRNLDRHTVMAGDIIFSSFIGDKIRAVVLPKHIEVAVNKADCFCLRVDEDLVSSKWLMYFLANMYVYKNINKLVHGATRPRINTKQLRSLVIPLLPKEEQEAVVERIEFNLSNVKHIETTIDLSITQIEQLRRSILDKAFQGQLVPQDPTDEPASKLLERIKAEKEASQEIQKKTKKKRTPVKTRKKTKRK